LLITLSLQRDNEVNFYCRTEISLAHQNSK
jgi:hypothetical protein